MKDGTYVAITYGWDGEYVPLMFIVPDAEKTDRHYSYIQECAIDGHVYDAEINIYEDEFGEIDYDRSEVVYYHYDEYERITQRPIVSITEITDFH